ncbi:alkaline phosphatase family protein [Geosporobacter ferrireducens]|uniref:Nucleotide pyrophosphatase n=1 Tax=Geosporobacter ferrireducens TaxID=1424294 RepID=A0A1D8GEU0_9FIRM|nr:alkaline phosphatase family protein [Geosporobacter ferrireducens]AOT69434.1 nucleotide pyrophosphatase [Geosporobacter ferrireducens]MTI56549.1 alkaline phosphatase family protein [Geosporobacter ferrireducens]
MQQKVILLLIDGLHYHKGRAMMGFLEHLVESKKAWCRKIKTELPTLSRPAYEVVLTGTPAFDNGITSNYIVRRSREKSVFQIAKEKDLVTAAAAYYWFSELYNRAPFDHLQDREYEDDNGFIRWGKFYFEDDYPDSHLILDGEVLRRKYDPHFLLIHPMGLDYVGHRYGCESKEYAEKIIQMDSILSRFLPLWMELDYQVLITGDHGMNAFGQHGGTGEDERIVPLWGIGSVLENRQFPQEISQLCIAPLLCQLLNIPKSKKMVDISSSGMTFC